jgi:methylmalonyl-CoA epimerase
MSLRIDHIAIVVNNLEAGLQVYRDALGLPLERIEEVPAEQVKVAFLPFPSGGGEIELLEPTTADSGVARFLAKRGEGVHHICLAVDDIEAAMADLRAKGLQVLEEQPRLGSRGQKYVFIHPKSAHGVLLELYEKPDVEK